jgi:SWI/SNF-related matrix-associated actin-dependent regulator 1 of chromatin subfamily A
LKTFDSKNGKLVIFFKVPDGEFQILLNLVKSIPNRVFASEKRVWLVPDTKENYDLLIRNGFLPTGNASDKHAPQEQVVIPPTPMAPIDESLLPKELRHYQIDGVKFLEAVKGRGVLGYDMRLGKSAVALSWCFLHPEKSPVLIISPASAKIGWQREIAKWSKDKSIILCGKTPHIVSSAVRYIILNYDILHDWQDYLIKLKPQVIIVDEVQAMANKKAKVQDKETGRTKSVPVKRTSAFLKIAKNVHHVISLSGTPFTSYPDKFWNILNITSPTLFPNRWEYLQQYCNPQQTPWGIKYEGVTNVDKLRSLLAQVMIRRRKQDVIAELPVSERIIVPLEIDKDKYDKESKEYELWFKEHADASDEEISRRMNLIKSISYDAKRKQIHDWVRNFIDTGEKLVLFAYHRDVVEDLYNTFKKEATMVYGGMDIKKRQKSIDFFQNKSIFKLFVGQINSTNTAISLSAADTVAFCELPFTVGDLLQAEERIFMPGDGKKRLTYYYLLAGDTVDEDRYKALLKKSKVFYSVMDGEDAKLEFEGKL